MDLKDSDPLLNNAYHHTRRKFESIPSSKNRGRLSVGLSAVGNLDN